MVLTSPKEIFRWAIVLAFGGFGLLELFPCVRPIYRNAMKGDWSWVLFELLLAALVAGAPLAIGYFAFRRQYRRLATLAAAGAALGMFVALLDLQSRLHLNEWMFRKQNEEPWFIVVALPVSLICLVGPVYAAAWSFHRLLRLADRYRHDESTKQGAS